MNKKGFTLIELIIAIVIITILAVLLIPTLGKPRELARRVQCTNNLRQIGVAWHLYLNDHNGKFPDDTIGGSDDSYLQYLFGGQGGHFGMYSAGDRVLNPYLDIHSEGDKAALEIFRCPGDRIMRAPRGALVVGGFVAPMSQPDESCFDYWGTSYNTNENLWGLNISSIEASHVRLWLTKDIADSYPHGGNYPRLKLIILFLDGHVGMHDYNNDFDEANNGVYNPSKDVYVHPNE